MILASIWWTVCFSLCFFCKVAAWNKLIQSIATVSQSLYELVKKPSLTTGQLLKFQSSGDMFGSSTNMGSTNPMFSGFDFDAGNRDCCSGHQRGAAEGFKKAPKKMPLRLKNATHRPDMWIKFRSICKYSHSICFFHLLKLHGAFYQTPCNLTYWRIHNANFCGHRSELPSVLIPGERCVLGQWDDPWSGK